MPDFKLFCGDCLDILPTLDDNSVSLIVTDPPYYKVKGEWWDRQWGDTKTYLEWMGEVLGQFHRVLKANGSLYLFAAPKMAARVEMKVGERFNVLNHIVWVKPDAAGAEKGARGGLTRSYIYQSERIIFAENYGADGMAKGESGYGAKCDEIRGFVFEPLRKYLDGERKRAGVDKNDIAKVLGVSNTMVSQHYFSSSQWQLPTEEHYQTMQCLFNRENGTEFLSREYEELRAEYEELRAEYEELRRPFSVSASVPYTDVWTFPTVNTYPGKHPCEKPLDMLEHIVRASSRPGDTVLDAFMGSGNSGVGALKNGRNYVGVDVEERWCNVARRKLQGLGEGENRAFLQQDRTLPVDEKEDGIVQARMEI